MMHPRRACSIAALATSLACANSIDESRSAADGASIPADGADEDDPPGADDGPGAPGGPNQPSDPSDPAPPDEPADPQPPACSYPSAGSLDGEGDVMPRLVWSDARRADGSTFSFDLLDAHCDPSINGIVFILSAGWCPSCPSYVAGVAAAAAQIEAAGGLLVFLELQDAAYQLASNADAQQTISGWAGTSAGIRVGDGGSDQPGFVYDSSIWSAVPGGFLVRTSDMVVTANQDTSPYLVDWVAELAALGAGAPAGPGEPECEEEASEPNDGPASAAPLAPGAIDGGVCGADDDYFHVTTAGSWRLDLLFSHAEGDLDLAVVNAYGVPVYDGGQAVRSDSADDDESLAWHDEAHVRVYGYQGAQASYTLSLSTGGL